MTLIFLCHPPTLGSTSMPRFARMIGEGMRGRGHAVEYWTSPHVFGRLPVPKPSLRKWLGYIDQFLIFPWVLRRRASRCSADTVFVVADQALGMWVPVIADRPHVIHCHDFLAQRSALGEFPENPTGWSGRKYQALIRRGYRRGRCFLSVSRKTQEDLHRFLEREPDSSEVVYNPLNYPFSPLDSVVASATLGAELAVIGSADLDPGNGFFLHVGGNQWYKNRHGVVQAYSVYARGPGIPLPLLLAGAPPTAELRALANSVRHGRVVFASGLSNDAIHAAYATATALVFPSLEEGFGWPIAEAMACGCPVITTDAAPMNEVGGTAAIYVSRRPGDGAAGDAAWAQEAAARFVELANARLAQRSAWREAGLNNIARFSLTAALDAYEMAYKSQLPLHSLHESPIEESDL